MLDDLTYRWKLGKKGKPRVKLGWGVLYYRKAKGERWAGRWEGLERAQSSFLSFFVFYLFL